LTKPYTTCSTDTSLKDLVWAVLVIGWLHSAAAPSDIPLVRVTLTAQPAGSVGAGGSLLSLPIELHASVADAGTGGPYTYTYLFSCGVPDAVLSHASPMEAQARCTYFSPGRFLAKVSVTRAGAAPVGANVTILIKP